MNVDFRYEDMTIVLVSKALKKLGAINNIDRSSIQFSLHMNSADELSFNVYKKLDEHEEALWDEIYSLRVIYCVELDKYFQIDVSEVDSVNPCKTITATALCESELSQIMLYNIEINTEIDIKREDYVITKFYNPYDTKGSLLHRVLEKAPHYTIAHVDETLWDLQRQFSTDNTSIYDFFQSSCAEQFNCIFKFGINEENNEREVYVYDLYTICMNDDCSYRIENKKRYRADLSMFLFGDKFKCPHCETNNLKFYGNDTDVYVDVENLTNEIQFNTLTDQIKNTFKLVGGDDNMTAAIRSQNPNGSDYLYYFSDETRKDMSLELNEALIEYDEDFKYYTEEYPMFIDGYDYDGLKDSNSIQPIVEEYNDIIRKYNGYYKTQHQSSLLEMPDPIVGYKNLMRYTYNNIDLSLFLNSGLMPTYQTNEVNSTTEKDELESRYKLGKFNKCSLQKVSASTSLSTVESALKNYAKLYVKSGYVKIEVITDSWSYNGLSPNSSDNYYGVWSGRFNITNYSDPTDISTTFNMDITIDMDYEHYMSTTVRKDLMTTLKDETQYFDVVDYDITYIGNYSEYYSYEIGDYCVKDFKYYKCLVAIDEGEVWTPSHWKLISEYSTSTSYSIGDYCTIKNNLYRCKMPTKGIFDSTCWTFGNICERRLATFKTMILPSYCKNRLVSFSDATQGCMNILATAGFGQINSEHYEWTYYPYYVKLQAINEALDRISRDIDIVDGILDSNNNVIKMGITQVLNSYIFEIQDELNLKNYLLDKGVYNEFCSFRREDKYENGNYISTGLSNGQLFDRANEFLDDANLEVVKAGTPQHQISSTIDNLFSLDEFKPFQEKCEIGNWIRIRVDEDIYRLRLITLSFNLSSFNTINVEFSDVTRANGIMSDLQSILNQTKSMASSYSYIQNQANASVVATETINDFRDEGLNFSDFNLKSSNTEEVTMDKNGILLRSYNDVSGTYENEQVRLINNSIVFTDDNWVTVKAALGKSTYHYYGADDAGILDCQRQIQALKEAGVESSDPRYIELEKKIEEFSKVKMRSATGFGLNSDFVESGNIYGSSIIGGEIYSTNYENNEGETPIGSYINMNDGTFNFAGGNLVFDGATLSMSGDISQTGGHVTVSDKNSNIIFNGDIDRHLCTISGLTVTKDSMYKNTTSLTSDVNGMYYGNNGIRNYHNGKYVNITDGKIQTDKFTDLEDAIYTKPSTGIPKSDLDSSVQTSLGKADSSYQKPSAGIPKTDLASAVQTSLGKADTALQKETYTGTITGIKMNGSSKGTSGVVDLGTVLTEHQDISGKADKTDLLNIAPLYEKKTYEIGDYCLYNYLLYKCKNDITTPEEWNKNNWQRTTIAEELKTLFSN